VAEKTKEEMDKKPRHGVARFEKEVGSKEKRERRMYPRYLLHLPIEYLPLNSPVSYLSHTINASEGGLMICLHEQLEVGKHLHLKIFFSSGPSLLIINPMVQVMWADEQLGEDGFYRHGVRFVDPASEDVQKFKDFLGTFISPFSRIERVGN
jgi:hypothetical protein